MDPDRYALSRRQLLGLAAAASLTALTAACGAGDEDAAGDAASATATTIATALPATPACDDGDDPTPEQTEGPYYTPDSPERVSFLEEGIAGTRLVVSGTVLDTSCKPVEGALLDFWHADDAGVYDHESFRLRGHQFTGAVQQSHRFGPVEPGNEEDRIFDERLLMDVQEDSAGLAAAFEFVVEAA